LEGKNEATLERGDRTWRRWKHFLQQRGLGADPFIDSVSNNEERVILARSFLVWYRSSEFDVFGRDVGQREVPMVSSTIRDAISHVASAFRKRGRPSPFHIPNGDDARSGRLQYRVKDLLRGFERGDGQVKKQKALPPEFIREMLVRVADENEKAKATVDLIVGGYFFAMRACEFCSTEQPGVTRPLRTDSIEFRRSGGSVINVGDPALMKEAYTVTVTFANQKNGTKGEKRTLKRTSCNLLCPVRAWARVAERVRLLEIIGPTPMNLYREKGRIREIRSKDVVTMLRESCEIQEGYEKYGIRPEELGTRSIRSGAAMALALQKDASDKKIMMHGRWKSDAFLKYIRPQVIEFAGDAAEIMTRTKSFRDTEN